MSKKGRDVLRECTRQLAEHLWAFWKCCPMAILVDVMSRPSLCISLLSLFAALRSSSEGPDETTANLQCGPQQAPR